MQIYSREEMFVLKHFLYFSLQHLFSFAKLPSVGQKCCQDTRYKIPFSSRSGKIELCKYSDAMWTHESLCRTMWTPSHQCKRLQESSASAIEWVHLQCRRAVRWYSVFRVDSSGANRARPAAYVLSAGTDSLSPSFQFYVTASCIFVGAYALNLLIILPWFCISHNLPRFPNPLWQCCSLNIKKT